MAGKIVLAVLFSIFLIAAIVPRVIQKIRRIETVGCIGIDKRLFFLGKLALFSSFALAIVQAFAADLSVIKGPEILLWSCNALAGIGVIFFTLAITKLGTFSLRVGLAKEETALRTTGIYRISRNPMVLGLYLIAIGSAVYVLNPINWVLVAFAIYVHHGIIRAEEAALVKRFGADWAAYRSRVRRYV
jgi:protein-S-isoprenylcysteine O-methyltransferase Ste14